jgi:hypothetical protein
VVLIKPAYSAVELPEPLQWSSFACGRYIQNETLALLRQYQRRFTPGKTLGLGALAADLTWDDSRAACALTLGPKGPVSVRSQLTEIGLKKDSVANVIAPFVLEFHQHPHQVLREVTRILEDDGVLMLCGFNPFSPAVISGFFLRHKKPFPWNGRYFSAMRIKDWLALLGYEVVVSSVYVPHFLHHSEHRGRDWSTTVCEFSPRLGAAYCIVARKQRLIERMKPMPQRTKLRVSSHQTAAAMTPHADCISKENEEGHYDYSKRTVR